MCWSTRATCCATTPWSSRAATACCSSTPASPSAEMACLARDLTRVGPARRGRVRHAPGLGPRALAPRPRRGAPLRHVTLRGLSCVSCVAGDDWRARAAEGLPPGDRRRHARWTCSASSRVCPHGATEIPWDGPQVRVVEHPAHSPGHAALVVEDRGVLVAGDMLSGRLRPDARRLRRHRRSARGLPRRAAACSRTSPTRRRRRRARPRVRRPRRSGVAPGSSWTAPTCTPCETVVAPTTRASAPRPSPAGSGSSDIHEGQVRSVAGRRGQ